MWGTQVGRVTGVLLLAAALPGPGGAADCNGNGVEDALEIGTRRPGFGVQREVLTGPLTEVIALGDFDGDARADILASFPSRSPHAGPTLRTARLPAIASPPASDGGKECLLT